MAKSSVWEDADTASATLAVTIKNWPRAKTEPRDGVRRFRMRVCSRQKTCRLRAFFG
ncbi:hypothetical protein [Blautia parvula]|uniref:hypothetical protein n=1 Tax=Blautia parvula TaxID=2877527 RepID=UPI0036F319AE